MKKNIFLITFIIALAFSSTSRAALIRSGDYTIDGSTGLAWLDTSRSVGYSYDQMLLDAGGYFAAGWRYATTLEMNGLFTRYVGYPADQWLSGSSYSNGLSLIRTMGVLFSNNNDEGSVRRYVGVMSYIGFQGFYNDGAPSNRAGFASVQARIYDTDPITNERVLWQAYDNFLEPYRSELYIGHFLVRSVNISEPSSFSLLLLVLPILFQKRYLGSAPESVSGQLGERYKDVYGSRQVMLLRMKLRLLFTLIADLIHRSIGGINHQTRWVPA